METVRRAVKAGVRIGMGSDAVFTMWETCRPGLTRGSDPFPRIGAKYRPPRRRLSQGFVRELRAGV